MCLTQTSWRSDGDLFREGQLYVNFCCFHGVRCPGVGRTPDTLLPVGSRVLPLPSIRTPPLEVAPPGTEGISLPVHSPPTLPPSNCPHAPTFSLALEVGGERAMARGHCGKPGRAGKRRPGCRQTKGAVHLPYNRSHASLCCL